MCLSLCLTIYYSYFLNINHTAIRLCNTIDDCYISQYNCTQSNTIFSNTEEFCNTFKIKHCSGISRCCYICFKNNTRKDNNLCIIRFSSHLTLHLNIILIGDIFILYLYILIMAMKHRQRKKTLQEAIALNSSQKTNSNKLEVFCTIFCLFDILFSLWILTGVSWWILFKNYPLYHNTCQLFIIVIFVWALVLSILALESSIFIIFGQVVYKWFSCILKIVHSIILALYVIIGIYVFAVSFIIHF